MTSADITVITASVPGRHAMLERCTSAVSRQSCMPHDHFIGFDTAHDGHGAHIRNRLIRQASSEWVACCDDDDWWDEDHLERLIQVATADGDLDVVVALYRLEDGSDPAGHCCDPGALDQANWFHPSSCLLRRSAVLAVGGFPTPRPPLWDDWALWQNLAHASARFGCLHAVTNTKGVHADNICGPRLSTPLG